MSANFETQYQRAEPSCFGVLRQGFAALAAFTLAVASASALPSITTAPASTNVCSGGTATFQVVATGTDPVIYAWYLNETNLLASTTDTLVVANVQAGDA